MYSIANYGSMINNASRMDVYAQALRHAIKPGATVLDIGTGTGFMALLACQFGAGKVYAIEPDEAIQLGRQLAVANGYARQIEFIEDFSTAVTLPEKVDIIVSDLRGALPLFQKHIPTIIDARQRFLAPSGILIPQRDVLYAALVNSSEQYAKFTSPWLDNLYDLNLQAGQRYVTNSWIRATVTKEQLLTEPQCWATLDYTTIESPDVKGTVSWVVEQSATAHGLCIWFDTTLLDNIGFSNAPGEAEKVYSRAFFPLSSAVELAAGDKVTVTIQADLTGDDYIWRWDTQVLSGANPADVKVNFKQSTFFGVPLSPAKLKKQAHTFVPELNAEGEIVRLVLELMTHDMSLGDIAQVLAAKFPARFATWQAALSYAGELSQKYSR